MKKLLTLAVALVALAVFSRLGAAQQMAGEKSQRTGMEMKQPPSGEKTMDKASPQLMKVNVLEVNEKAKTFTVMVKGKPKTLNVPDLKSLPKAGDIIEITVSEAGGDGTARLVCVTVQYGTKTWCCHFFNGAPSGCGYL
jgi:hypothetical protein